MDCSPPDIAVLHNLLQFAQIYVHWVSDAIQISNPLSLPSFPALGLSQHQGLFQWTASSHQIAKALELPTWASVFPMNIQGWLPFGLTGLISLQSKRPSKISTTKTRKHQFFNQKHVKKSCVFSCWYWTSFIFLWVRHVYYYHQSNKEASSLWLISHRDNHFFITFIQQLITSFL